MEIEDTSFGSITIDGKTYPHDVLIRSSGEIKKRKKKLSKKYYGTSHVMSLEEAEFIYEKKIKLLVVGTGQDGNLRLSPEAAEFFARNDYTVLAAPTPRAIELFNQTRGHKTGLFHVTC